MRQCKLDRLSEYGTIFVGRYAPRNNQDRAQGFSVIDVSVHPSFDGEVCCGRSGEDLFYGVHNDFMLLKLSGESSNLPIRLNTNIRQPQSGDELTVIGFGDIDPGSEYVEPDRLREVTVNYMTNTACVNDSVYSSKLLTAASMCAADANEDACAGDSGGPLIVKGSTSAEDLMVGVVSWGWDCAVEPGVYARVSQGYGWIRQEVCRLSANPPASFRCPTPAPRPTPKPTSLPTKRPTHMPTRRPTNPPTIAPTKEPSAMPSSQPTIEPTTEPTQKATILARTMTPMVGTTTGPTTGPITDISPNIFATGNRTVNTTPPAEFLTPDDDAPFDELETLARKAIQRRHLPAGKSCSAASLSPEVCCSSISNKEDATFGDDCIPARGGSAFEGGFPCEASSWVKANDPKSYDPSICDNVLNESTEVSLFADRHYLPMGISCSNITPASDCCHFLDNRSEQDSIYHGQPCVPLRPGIPNLDLGTCQPANALASTAAGRGLDCKKLRETTMLSNSTNAFHAYLQELLEGLKEDTLLNEETKLQRVDLPAGQQCQSIRDPFLCCAARYADVDIRQDCVPVKASLLGATSTHRSRVFSPVNHWWKVWMFHFLMTAPSTT